MWNERQQKEKDLLKESNFLTIKQLAMLLNVSEMTVRRDIPIIIKDNCISQVHGGLVYKQEDDTEAKYEVTLETSKNQQLKKAIAMKALEYIHDNMVIFFDSGTTINILCNSISKDASFTAITSSYEALVPLTNLTNSTIITPGGVFSNKPRVFYDLESIKSLKRYRGNIAFIGATGYEMHMGLTCAYTEDAPLKQAIMESCQTRILLIDSSKFGIVSTCFFSDITEFSVVITDKGIPAEYENYIRKCGNIELIIT
ncbi:DeoR/GlpR family DNA-binding transcription regulator [uncultured Sphaerochaeta sp.]|uniref:DeoR/GlpR family DNA-binding transcription regulator n=1 Tax=uncultured Sphaerochaeta sp. TaxID=886478 RepID=UPI002A0A228E|nr:DeoR/GlpR family DNA-binding transcription regulator [uncultured Sphaerochaeta sp.]